MHVSRSIIGLVCAPALFVSMPLAQAQPAPHVDARPPTLNRQAPTASASRALAAARPTRWQSAGRSSLNMTGHAARGTRGVPLGTATQSLTIVARTGTAYVTSDEGTISVVDVGHCNVRRSGSCAGPVAELAGPSEAIGVAVYGHRST